MVKTAPTIDKDGPQKNRKEHGGERTACGLYKFGKYKSQLNKLPMHLCITGIVGKQERIISMKFNTVVTFRERRKGLRGPSLFVMCYSKNLRQMWKILRSVMLGGGAGYLFEILLGVHFCMLKYFKINTKKDSVP